MFLFDAIGDRALIATVVKSSFDRPEMLSAGADPESYKPAAGVTYLAAREKFGAPVLGLFAFRPLSPVACDIHVLLTPACRGRRAIAASRAFVDWLAANRWKRAVGFVPAYNKPMLYIAHSAGFRTLATLPAATMRNGKLEDLVIVEREIGGAS